MTEFSEGDLIEATKGDTVIRARVIIETGHGGPLRLNNTPWSMPTLDTLRSHGYTLTLIEKAAPALPTEPGVYRSRTGELWAIEGEGERLKWVGEDFIRVDPNNYVPFIRLEPVADTLARIAPQLEEVARCIAQSTVINTPTGTVDVMKGRKILADVLKDIQAVSK